MKRPTEPPPSLYRMPDPRRGRGPHGLLASGADYEPGTLLAAYRAGIFPWPSGEARFWCSPDPRPLFLLDREPRWHRSLARALRKRPFRVTVDRAFDRVVELCGDRVEGTWITDDLREGYRRVHDLGWAHSLEVWNEGSGDLVGGIFGVAVGASFSADSMFHRETDASKIAFASLVARLRERGFHMLDAQVPNDHLTFLGCEPFARADFLARLAVARDLSPPFPSE
jgi:leucyl/phenylalanyl-tRNA--protein transferase